MCGLMIGSAVSVFAASVPVNVTGNVTQSFIDDTPFQEMKSSASEIRMMDGQSMDFYISGTAMKESDAEKMRYYSEDSNVATVQYVGFDAAKGFRFRVTASLKGTAKKTVATGEATARINVEHRGGSGGSCDVIVSKKGDLGLSTTDVTMLGKTGGSVYDFHVLGVNDASKIKVTSNNTSVATVQLVDANDPRGAKYRITALPNNSSSVKGVMGTKFAYIGVEYNGQKRDIRVQNCSVAGSVMVDTTSYTMPTSGGTYQIGVTIKDGDGNKLSAKEVKWLLDAEILKVSDSRNGSVVALQQLDNGDFRITAILSKAGISDKSYFSGLPKDMQQQIARMLTLSQDLGSGGHDKYVYDYAKQLLVWEITLGYRNAVFEYKDNNSKILFNNIGNGAGAKDGVNLTAQDIITAYQNIEVRMKEYLKRPGNTEVRSEEAQVAANLMPVTVPAPTPENPQNTKVEKWTAEIKDQTWKYTDVAVFNSNPTAQKYKLVMTMLPDNAGVHIEMPNPTNPDGTPLDETAWNTVKSEIEAAAFGADKTQNKQLAAVTGNDFYCYATTIAKDQKLITGTPKPDPIPLYFKLSLGDLPDQPDQPDQPDEPEPEPSTISIRGQKYGEYDDAGGLGGATIVLYQTAGYEKVKVEDGEEKPKVPEYELVQSDEPKRVASTKSKSDGSFVFRGLQGGEYYAQELDHATSGGYTLEGATKPVNNYLNPTVFSEDGEVFEFTITMETDPEAKPPYSLSVDGDMQIEMYNYQQHGMITVEKRDKETGSEAQGDGTLQGAKFSILQVEGYEDDGTPYGMVVENLITNEQATSSALQEEVKYCVTETNAPMGYLLYSNEDKGAWYQEFMFEFDGDHDPDIVTELGGNVYQEHKDEYEQAHGVKLEKVDHITYPLYIQNQTSKRYVQIVKKDAVSGKLVPLNDFYFKVWDCTRNRWVEDNRNSTILGNIDIWQTNAQGQAEGANGEDLAGKANLTDFLEFSEKGYDVYEVHPHAGYYLSETPVHFEFNYDTYKPEEPVIVEFFNKPVLGNATLHKTGQGATNVTKNEDGTTCLEFTDVNLKGAVFGVYVADEQPIRARDVDKTIRANRNTKRDYSYTVDTEYPETTRTISFTASDTLNAGALVETLITDENGIIKTSDLYEGNTISRNFTARLGMNWMKVKSRLKSGTRTTRK